MHVIVISDYGFVNGGASQVVVNSLEWASLGSEGTAFVFGVGPADARLRGRGLDLHNLGQFDLLGNPSRFAAAIKGIWNWAAADKLDEVLASYDPGSTVVHLHTWVKSLSVAVLSRVARAGFPCAVTLHDYFSVCPNGALFNFVRRQHCHLKPMSLACAVTNCDARSFSDKLWRYSRQIATNHTIRQHLERIQFVAVSDYSAKLLAALLPVGASITRIDNPIRVERCDPIAVAENQAFLFVGRLAPEKGACLMASACARANVPAWFVGSGSEESCIRNLSPSARMLGWLDDAGVEAAMREARAFVFPSVWHETQGLVVVEAMARGLPVIVPDQCAASDFVVDGVTGLLFRSGDEADLAKKIQLLRDSPSLVSALGTEAYRRYWRNPLSAERHVRELRRCYENLLKDVPLIRLRFS